MTSQPTGVRGASDLDVSMTHVLVESAHVHELVWHNHCLSCGSTEEVLRRRVETRTSQPGVHFMTWTGRSLRIPLCLACGTRLRNRLEAPLVVWFLALPAAVGILAFAFGGRLLPFPGVMLTVLISVPVWLVRRWQNFWPLKFDVTDYKDYLDFEWADYDRAAEFAALNGTEVL